MTTEQAWISTASAKIGAMGSAFYFVEGTRAKGQELGLGTLGFYVLGRGGVLGDVEAPVVQSAFGYFEPGFLQAQWERGRAIVPPRVAAREYFQCCAELGRAKLAEVVELGPLCEALEAVNRAADPAGLALYAGLSAEPLVEDLPGRALQLVAVLREFRGSAHLVAIVAQLLEPKIAHYIRRPEMFEAFGWSDDQVPEVTDEHRRQLAAADELTDRIVGRAYGVLNAGQVADLLRGLDAMERALAR